MADYQEGHVLTNKKTGDRVQLQDGQWISIGPTVATDIGRSTLPSLVRGAAGLATAPRGAMDIAKRGIAWGTEQAGFPDTANRMRADVDKGSFIPSPFFPVPASKVISGLEKVTGPMYHPQTTPGKYYSAGVEALPGIGVGGFGVPNAVKTLTGALGSEAAGQAAEGSDWETMARVLGGVAGSKAPSAARRVVTPLPASPEQIARSQNVESRGVHLGAGQFTGNPHWNAVEAPARRMAGTGSGFTPQEQAQDVSRALNRSTGAPNEMPSVAGVRQQGRALGTEREALANRTAMPVDPTLRGDMTTTEQQFRLAAGLPRTGRAGSGATPLDQFTQPGGPNSIVGPAGPGGGGAAAWTTGSRFGNRYLELRDQLRREAEAATSPALRTAYYQLRDSMDRAMQRGTHGTPDEGAFERIHGQMANNRALGQVMNSGSPEAAHGIANPGQFQTHHSNPSAEAPTFARDANAALNPPSWGSQFGHGLYPTLAGGALGVLGAKYLGPHVGIPDPGIYGLLMGPAAAGAIYNPVTSKALMSGPVQGYLRNQLARPSPDALNPWANRRRAVQSVVTQAPRFEDGEQP